MLSSRLPSEGTEERPAGAKHEESVNIVGMNCIGRNSLATFNRRKLFLSTYSLNSNESSIGLQSNMQRQLGT